MLASIYQQKACADIYYCGIVVQPASQLNGYERIFKDMNGYWQGGGSRAAGVGQCMVGWPWIIITDMNHG
jgi:hypothetical protein